MAGKKKSAKKRKRILWTAADLKFLRKSAGKSSLASIARNLKRSPAAVRFKASDERISLRLKRA